MCTSLGRVGSAAFHDIWEMKHMFWRRQSLLFINCTRYIKSEGLDNIPKQEHTGREGSSLLIQPLLSSSSKGKLDSLPPWLWHFPGWGKSKPWEKLTPVSSHPALAQGRSLAAEGGSPDTKPNKSPPLFFQPQYFMNQLKSGWLVFLLEQFWKHHGKKKKKKVTFLLQSKSD